MNNLAISIPNHNINLKKYPIDKLIDNSITDFDLFIDVQGHLILYASSGYKWFRDEIQSLMKQGYTHLYIREQDEHKAILYSKINTLPKINKNEPPAKRIKSIEDIGTTFISYLYNEPLTPSLVEVAKNLVHNMIECIAEDISCIRELGGLATHDYYTFSHSVRVSAYCLAISITLGLKDTQKLKEIGIGALFHDIGKKLIDISIINKTGALNSQEWKQMKNHTIYGVQLTTDTILTYIPQEIILHHHEKQDGSGYPHAISKSEIIPEVQIATVADIFDALTSTRSYQFKRSRYEALDFMKHNLLNVKIAKEPYQALILSLAPENKN